MAGNGNMSVWYGGPVHNEESDDQPSSPGLLLAQPFRFSPSMLAGNGNTDLFHDELAGNVLKELPENAHAALHFLQSYAAALDVSNYYLRACLFSPTATIQSNSEPPTAFSSLEGKFKQRDALVSRSSHVVNHIRLLEQEGFLTVLLIDWTFTTVFTWVGEKEVVVRQFTEMTLGEAEPGKGSHDLWVSSIKNWMDTALIRAALVEIKAKAAEN